MALNRIYVGEQIENRLRMMKARTGLTPNLICRMALCLSLSEPSVPDVNLYNDGQAREFNRYTLLGQWDGLFFALLRERLVRDGLDSDAHLEEQLRAHISRGVMLLAQRVKSLDDLTELIVEQQGMAPSAVG